MIRGLQKQIIQLSTPKSKYFEVVFFVLRPTRKKRSPNEDDMVREAKRILAQSTPPKRPSCASPKRQKLALFFGGALCGSLFVSAVIALFAALL